MRGLWRLLFVCAAVSGSAHAQTAAPRDFATYRPTVAANYTEAVPVIDGDLSDPAWRNAAVIDEFYQADPVEGAAPSQKTRVLVMYDDRHLYFGVHAFEVDTDDIDARIMQRDGQLFRDDFIRFLIDSYDTGRDSFVFEVNPLGARREGLGENNQSITFEWDTIWRADARIVEDGWTAELAIPFQSISVDPNADDWGFQISREIRRTNERIRWSSINQALRTVDMSRAGRLSGIKDVEYGFGFDAQIFGTSAWRRNWERPNREDDFTFEPSGNAYYKITPSLTGTLTFNTDFSDAELDARQVNTTRFSLFFPETRDFFLQDSQIFEFGGAPLRRPGFNSTGGGVNGRPFFSRRIGILDEGAVDIAAGAKLSGSLGPVNIGALSTRMRRSGDLDPQQLSVMRASVDVFGETRMGAILTHGDPLGETENTVIGTDFQYRNTEFFGDSIVTADLFYQRSISDVEADEDDAFGVEVAFPNDRYFGRLMFKEIGEGFTPKLGFANRTGVRQYDGVFRYRVRPQSSFLRTIDFTTDNRIFTDLYNAVETRENEIEVAFENNVGDDLSVYVIDAFEDIREAFELPTDIIVPIGEYRFQRAGFEVGTGRSRPFQIEIGVECCEFFDGDRLDLSGELLLRPSRFFSITLEHEINRIDLPTGDVTIHVSAVNSVISLTPNAQFVSQLQYDNISEGFGYSGRFRWELRPETEIFLALTHSALTDLQDFRSQTSGAALRIGNTFRF